MTFTQLTTRLKNFVMGWLLVSGLKEGLVKCGTVCVKSEVIITYTIIKVRNFVACITKNSLGLRRAEHGVDFF